MSYTDERLEIVIRRHAMPNEVKEKNIYLIHFILLIFATIIITNLFCIIQSTIRRLCVLRLEVREQSINYFLLIRMNNQRKVIWTNEMEFQDHQNYTLTPKHIGYIA